MYLLIVLLLCIAVYILINATNIEVKDNIEESGNIDSVSPLELRKILRRNREKVREYKEKNIERDLKPLRDYLDRNILKLKRKILNGSVRSSQMIPIHLHYDECIDCYTTVYFSLSDCVAYSEKYLVNQGFNCKQFDIISPRYLVISIK